MTQMLDVITYSSIVTTETGHIALMVAASHDIQLKAVDILNAYVMAPNRVMIKKLLGWKFEDDAGKSTIIVRVLYGLKSMCASFRAHLALFMDELEYHSCKADADL